MSKDISSKSGGVSQGDGASGNRIATGGVRGDFIGGDQITNIYEVLSPAVRALHQLPSPPADFTGREAELAELLSAIENTSLAISCLQGMGGVGKTSLALKLAEGIKDRYPDGQFYLD